MNERTVSTKRKISQSGQGQPLKRVGRQHKPHISKKSRIRRKFLATVLITAAAAFYLLYGMKYRNTFLPNTVIGGVPVSGMTIEEVKEEINTAVSGYELILEERNGKETISGKEIELYPVYEAGNLERILDKQNPFVWGIRCIKGEEFEQNYVVAFNKEKLVNRIDALDCMDEEQITEPVNASLAYTEERGLQIVPEIPGDSPVRERLYEEIEKAVLSLQKRISLEEQDIYKKPEILADDAGLLAEKEALKPYADVTVTYRFGSRLEILDGSTILQWLSYDAGGNIGIMQEQVEEYVQELARKYNTAYCTKEFKTSYGPQVSITKGNYGWMIDKQAETASLIEILQSGESQEREPAYLQTAASHDGPDYGDTYVEINLTAQHLYYYLDGKLLIESDFVSGDEARGWSTPAGAYQITYKQYDAVLKGKNYNTPVTYWIPFNGDIGMHDGYWRSSFGGTIYKKSGSHGCINLPPAVAKTIYENIEAGVPVLCYHLEGTETNQTTDVPLGKSTSSQDNEGGALPEGTEEGGTGENRTEEGGTGEGSTVENSTELSSTA